MKVIDLRSDTVTLPTPAMRQAMYEAECGDDVWGEDPTVGRLERMAAQVTGKEAAVFVVSGTMGNLTAVLSWCGRGDEAIVGDQAHVFLNEAGGASALGGVAYHTAPNDERGRLAPRDVEAAIRADNIHYPRTGLVCLENTHNRCSGAVLTPQDTRAVAEVAHRHGIPVHLDGARLFNAAVYLGIPARELTKDVDSVSFCLSKGLCAPIGSLLCGSGEFIRKARRIRKMLGGGMRQVGVIAAAGIVALEAMVDRLAEDHQNAHRLAVGLAGIPGIRLDPERVQTNIVIFQWKLGLAPELIAGLGQRGVKASYMGGDQVRMVTHHGVTAQDIEDALTVAADVAQSFRAAGVSR
ncbi:MAG: low-specificity L-threonine aldolase [Chloroflexi bacterium]|nr:low-specificity L-threonine aldolase [Chloroflexota bacterium]